MNSISLPIFFQLLRRDLLAFMREFPTKFIDTCILFFTNVIIFAYFMPGEGLSESYGPFMMIGSVASFGLIEVVGKVSMLLDDIDGDRSISNILIMPIRYVYVFLYIVLFWCISSVLLSLLLLPLGKLLIFTRFSLENISYQKFVPIYLLSNLFFGAFALWITSILRGMDMINAIWLRFIAPMWMFGAYFYSWQTVYEYNHIIGYVSFLNPMVYVMEGMHSSSLGAEGYLPYWVCTMALCIFITFFCCHAIIRLRKRLDCV